MENSFVGKRVVVLFALAVALSSTVAAQQLTTVAVVDVNRVYTTFYRDSETVRELEQLRRQYQNEIDNAVQELQRLQEQRTRAENAGNEARVESLTQQISEQRRFVEDLTQRRRNQLQQRQDNLLTNDFLSRMQQAIEFVAENEGYTVVFRTDQNGLQWWSPTVDITESVLQRLRQMSR